MVREIPETRRTPTVAQSAAAVALYATLWLAADFASSSYAGNTGLSVWDVRAALGIVLYLLVGWQWWPLPVALAALRLLAAPQGFHAGIVPNIAASVPYELTYALSTKIALDVLRLRFPLRSLRDVGLFVALLCGAAPILANGLLLTVVGVLGTRVPFVQQFLQGTIADATSILVVVPIATVFLWWNEQLVPDEPAGARMFQTRTALQALATLSVVVLEYLWITPSGRPLVEFSFLPLAWMSINGGMRAAALGVLVCDLAATAMHVILAIPVDSQIEYQGFLIAGALTALLLGAVSTERLAVTERLRRAAYFDALTSLPNRLMLDRVLAGLRGQPLVLLLLDVSDIRLLNEAIGRASSDGIMVEFARRLRDGLAAPYVVARINYEEFAVALPGASDPADSLDTVRALMAQPFRIEDAHVYIEPSIGAAGSTGAGDAGDALRRADTALRHAKESIHRASTYGNDGERGAPQLPIVDLHRAVERGELIPFFQPIYRYDASAARWNPVGAEALLRWRHPERGLIMPDQFIGLLDRLSIGTQVGRTVIDESLRLAARWRQTIPEFQVWVNLFPRQMLDPGCAAQIRASVEAAGTQPGALVVEITEKMVAGHDSEVASLASTLQTYGVTVAIDDFGTGSSSLSRLREVPVQLLKIDRSFVSRCDVDDKARTVAYTVARLAAELGIDALAEGVENREQAAVMLDAGCSLAQGYTFAHPMPAATFEAEIINAARLPPG